MIFSYLTVHQLALFEARRPLQRLLSSGMVGAGYQPEDGGTQYYKTVSYRYNTSGDGNIIIWVPSGTGTFTTDGNYAVSTLSVMDGKDEDGTEVLTFTDRSGHLILKRQLLSPTNLDTYYLYNMAGMLSYVIPPQATSVLGTNPNLLAAPLSNMVFYYTYNSFGQIVSRKVPAKGTMNIIYDPLHRPVLSQDANMAAGYQWSFIKYDVKGRAIESGVYTDTNTGRTSVSGMQSYVSGLSYTTWYESRTSTLTSGGYYTSTVFPVTGTSITLTPLSYSYFDDYFMTEGGSANFSYSSQGLTGEETQTTAQVKGMPTMTSMTTVGSGLTSTWLTKVTFYDHRLNPIQTQSNNHVYYTSQTTITDYATVVPDFVGVPQQTYVTKKTATSTTIQVLTAFSYDQMYRIKNVSQAYNGGPTATVTQVAAYSYNEAGQAIKKSLGYVNSTTWLQNVDMRYNIRGQLLSINNSTLTSDGGITNSDTNDAFGAIYLYDQSDGNLGNSAYHNGKLSAVKWMSTDGSGTKTKERAFLYSYDGVNRYTASTYEERVTAGTGAFNNNLHGFDEYAITYDLDGNIKTLKRNSSTQGTNTHIQIDSLTYSYNSTTIPDELNTVTDGTGSNYTGAGFRNLTNSSGSYSYDSNGNLTIDPYKGLTLAYDYLNRTDKITVTTSTNRYIYYTYNAAGQLIRKQEYDNAALVTTTDYIDGFVYLTPSGSATALSYFPMPEGRVVNTNPGGTLTLAQEFIITDQQGNARVSFRNNSGTAQVFQENSYYGFGLIMPNSPVTTPTVPNKQLYNGGSEWQSDYTGTGNNMPDYYQTYNRNYDAALARWVGVDPMADGAESMSVYQYSGNNPIMFNDPLGNLLPTPGSHNSQTNYVDPNRGDDFGDADEQDAQEMDSLWAGAQAFFAQNSKDEAENNPIDGGNYSAFWISALSGADDIMDALGVNGLRLNGAALADLARRENAISLSGIGTNAASSDVLATSLSHNDSGLGTINASAAGSITERYQGASGPKYDFVSADDDQVGDPFAYAGNLFHLPGQNIPLSNSSYKQYENTCVFYAVSAALNFYGLSTKGFPLFNQYTNNMTKSQKDYISGHGIDPQVVYNKYLIGEAVMGESEVINALLKGEPVLGTFQISPTQSHEVFITGFSYLISGPDAGFNYTFWNPATGEYGNKSPIIFYGTFSVSGIK